VGVEAFDKLVVRIRKEYVGMPGLRLTIEQGSRLWGLERDQCADVLQVLVERAFLALGADGKYGRPSDSADGTGGSSTQAVQVGQQVRELSNR
jgi:hypothetical protein